MMTWIICDLSVDVKFEIVTLVFDTDVLMADAIVAEYAFCPFLPFLVS